VRRGSLRAGVIDAGGPARGTKAAVREQAPPHRAGDRRVGYRQGYRVHEDTAGTGKAGQPGHFLDPWRDRPIILLLLRFCSVGVFLNENLSWQALPLALDTMVAT
jgi:hypothetical protein